MTLKYKLTKKDLYEYVIHVLFKKLLEFGLVVSVWGICFFTVLCKNHTLVVVALICLACTILMPPLTVWEMQRNAKALGEDNDSGTTLIFADSILLQEEKVNIEVAYSQVLKICETKHLYVLMFGKNNGIVFPKTSCQEADFAVVRSKIYDSKVSEALKGRLIDLKRQGQTVEAVKAFRQYTKLGVSDAKRYMETL